MTVSKPIPWKKGTYLIRTNHGLLPQSGYLSPKGIIAVRHTSRAGGWTLTHLPTGLAAGSWPTFKKAKEVGTALEAIPGLGRVTTTQSKCKAVTRVMSIIIAARYPTVPERKPDQ